jgi:probable F420-dependent oxidoreductase
VKIGAAIWATEDTMPVAEVARRVEQAGLESLWFSEHTHIPVERRTPWPGGDELPPEYERAYDPLVACAAAAAVTSTLLVGTGVCLVAQRDPIVLAKAVASIDHLSQGRFLFGIGAGWNAEEMENHGVDVRTRFRRLRESVEAMKEIWTQEVACYDGTLVRFTPLRSRPKPVRRPHPPILVGGSGPGVLGRVVAYGDEWMPNAARGGLARVRELQRLAREHGRAAIPATAFGVEPTADLDELASLGFHRAVFLLPTAGADRVVPAIAELAAAHAGA